MKTFKIPVIYEMYGTIEVKAKSLKEAIEIVKRDNVENDSMPLILDDYYVENSFKIDYESSLLTEK